MKPFVARRTVISEKHVLAFLLIVCSIFHSCKKSVDQPQPPAPTEPKTKAGKLKEIITPNIPNPVYRFDYTDSGETSIINFASGFFIYKLEYVNGRLDRMINTFNDNALIYTYSGGKVTTIREIRTDNKVLWNYSFDYNRRNLPGEVRWYLLNAAGTDSVLYRKVILDYGTDGNLHRFDDYRNVTGQLEWVQAVEYSDYDEGKNVDDFSILKEFGDNLLYLPGVRLQQNNPRTTLITGPDNDFETHITWQYQNGLPVAKTTRLIQIRGNNIGELGQFTSSYSYY